MILSDLQAQETEYRNDSLQLLNHKTAIVIGTASLAYATSMTGLYQLWYKDYPQSAFHFFNDNGEWLQADKCGHFVTSYQIGRLGFEMLKWSGATDRLSVMLGGFSGLIFLSTVEVFDGFSSQWGFSAGDMAANTLGSAMFITQQLAWKEQRIMAKWSYRPSAYAKYNPKLLGESLPQCMIKDYNAQTFWLSANLSSFGVKSRFVPNWLNIAFGYGADGMVGAKSNPVSINSAAIPEFTRSRQFYISPDVDLTRIKTNSKTLKILLKGVSFVKIPMPAVEFGGKGIKLHLLFF